jgi:uncharacterized membrane protein
LREYISPNWHAVLIHAPLGLLSVGILIEILSFLWRRSSARSAGRWMILLGAITCVPALTTGIYAYRDALAPTTSVKDVEFDDTWPQMLESTLVDRTSGKEGDKLKTVTVQEFLASAPGKALYYHLLYNCIGVGAIFVSVLTFIGSSDLYRRRLYLPLLLILLVGEGLVIFGSHFGGLAVYEHAVAVKPSTPTVAMKATSNEILKAVLPPAQLHVMLSGWVVAMALIALALSIRAVSELRPIAADEDWYEGQPTRDPLTPGTTTLRTGDRTFATAVNQVNVETVPMESSLTDAPDAPLDRGRSSVVVVTTPSAPLAIVPTQTSRYWLLATLFAVMTFITGLWLINTWNWPALRDTLRGQNRNMYHSILGCSLIALTLLLALVTRIARRSKGLISALSLLLFLVVGLQIWVGVLLMFDGPKAGEKGQPKTLLTPFKLHVPK